MATTTTASRKRRSSETLRDGHARPRRRRKKGPLGVISMMGPVLFLPIMMFYEEFFFHIYMKEGLRYLPVWLIFSIAMGLFFSLFALNFSFKVNRIITEVITIVTGVVFCIELMTKKILASYYQLFSIAKTAANNKLTDYMSAIIQGFFTNILGILMLMLPTILLFLIGRNFLNFKRKYIGLSVVTLAAVAVLHVFGLLMIHLPWKGDVKPSKLYQMDTNLDDQVQQLGILTMLRLDLKHTLFGVKANRDDDFVDPGFDPNQVPVDPEKETEGAGEQPTENGNAALFTNTDFSPNVMNVDLAGLAAGTGNADLAWLCNYFNSVTPSNKNKYTGAFKDFNVIYITAEGLTGYGISPELTPTLYKLSQEGFVFNNFYTALHFTSTAGGECQNMTGLYPKNGGQIITQDSGDAGTNWYFTLPQQLNRLGYESAGFHANGTMYNRIASHTNMGYTWVQDGTGFNMELKENGKKVWPQSDVYCVEQTVDSFINSEKPFNVYYLSISGHMPYGREGGNAISIRNEDLVANLPYTENTKGYLGTVIELDRSVEYLLNRLEQAGKLDKTLIVLAPDHIPYFDVATMEELAGKSFTNGDTAALANSLKEDMITDYNLYKSTLIMWSGAMKEPVQVNKTCCQVDILPTISNLLGLEYDSRMLSGTDILSDSMGVVLFNSGSWLSDAGYYDRYSQTFTLHPGVNMSEEDKAAYAAAMKKIVGQRREISDVVLNANAYEYIFPGTKNSSTFVYQPPTAAPAEAPVEAPAAPAAGQ